MALLASDVSRLVHHYLLQKGFDNTANQFICECVDLKGLKPVKAPFKLPRLLGPSLLDLLNGYYDTKDCILEELESFNSAEYNVQDSLPTLTKTLIHSLKQSASSASPRVPCEKHDASTNTDFASIEEKLKLDASVSANFTSIKPTCDIGVNTEPCPNTSSFQVSIASGPTAFVDEDSGSLCSSYPPSVEQGEEISFFTSLVVDRLIENREIQERIAERINKRSTEVLTPKKSAPNLEDDTLSHDISSVIKAIAEETTSDPAFNAFVKDVLGLESSQCPTPVGTPKRVSAQECDQPSPAAPAPELEPPVQDPAKEKLPTAEIYEPPPENSHNALVSSLASCPAPNNDYAQLNMNQFSGYVCVADASGQLTLVPSLMTSMPPVLALPPSQGMQYPEESSVPQTVAILNIVEQEEQAPQKATTKPASKRTRKPLQKKLATLAPKPPPEQIPIIITIPNLSEYEDPKPDEAAEQVQKDNGIDRIVEVAPPAKTKPKPFVKAISHLKAKKNKELGTYQTSSSLQSTQTAQPETDRGPAPVVCNSPPVASSLNPPPVSAPSPVQSSEPPQNPAIPTALEALLRIAKKEAETISPKPPTPLQASTGIRPDAEMATTTPAPESVTYITTPTSSSRRRNHVRQLNFGESPDLPIASSQPIPLHVQSESEANSSPARPGRPLVPWDLALRNALASASPAKDQNIFATPKGKAKRAKKTSPVAQTPPKGGLSKEKSSVKRTLETLGPQEPHEEAQPKADKEQEKPVEEIDLIANESFEDSLPGITISQPELSPPSSSITVKTCSRGADSNEAAAACGLIEMANSNPVPCSQGEEQVHVSFSHLQTQFPQMLPVPAAQSQNVPVHATPQKDPVMCEGHSSMSFGAWYGEPPRTPQIRLDVTNSNSPFQVSLTKGFRFLPAAESPSLSVPLTPSIVGTNSNSSIETPYVGFNQFASILNTPRVEALRQEFGDSPSRSLSTTMISPTQVVLGRSAPYFVPSGERAQGPPMNNIATPEHVPESDKKTRRRSCSTDMEPLQLEESNDASDAATALMSEAAANVAAALEKPVSQPPTPSKSDHTLESDLINECRRLESAPPSERGMTRRELLVSLFGEDSESGPVSNQARARAGKASTSKPTRKQPARARKASPEKQKEAAAEPTRRTAKKATVSNTPVRSDRKRDRSVNCSSEDAAGRRTPEVLSEKDDETIIKELLSLARIKEAGTVSSARKKRKRSSSPSRNSRELDLESRTPPSKRLPPSSGSKCPPSDVKSPESEVTREIASTSIETSFSQEESEMLDEETPKKSKPGKKSDKDKKKLLVKTICSPIPRIIRNTVIKTPATATPVRLFKPANSFGRLSRQRRSVSVRRRPVVSDAPAEGRELELSSIPEEPAPDAPAVAENNNRTDYDGKETEQHALSAETSASLSVNVCAEIRAQQVSNQAELPGSNVNNANYCEVLASVNSKPILQSSIFNESTLAQDVGSSDKNEESPSCPPVIPVSPVTRSQTDLSASMQPVNPPVDPGPNRMRTDAPAKVPTNGLVGSRQKANQKKESPEKSSVDAKQKRCKKRQSDPKLQNYVLLSNVSTKPPETRKPEPVPFQTVQNRQATPQSSHGAHPSSSASSHDIKTYNEKVMSEVRKKMRVTSHNNLFSQ